MSILSRYDDVVRAVAERNEVPVELLMSLLALEKDHGNLHSHGARPALRRAVAEIIDSTLEANERE